MFLAACTTKSNNQSSQPSTSASSETTASLIYTNEDYGFSIDPPEGSVTNTPSDSSGVSGVPQPAFAVSFDSGPDDLVGIAVACYALPQPMSDAEKTRALRRNVRLLPDQMAQAEPSSTMLSISMTTFAGVPACCYERLDEHASQTAVHMREYVFFGDDMFYTVMVRAPADQWATLRPDLLRAANSFRLL